MTDVIAFDAASDEVVGLLGLHDVHAPTEDVTRLAIDVVFAGSGLLTVTV